MKWPVVGGVVVGLAVATYCGLEYRTKVIKNNKETVKRDRVALRALRQNQFLNGTLPLIDGPYLEPGNVDDLKFIVTKLPRMPVARMAPEGNILLGPGAKKNAKGRTDWSVFTRDQKVIPLTDISWAFMDTYGRAFSIEYSGDSNIEGTIYCTNGTMVKSKTVYRLTMAGGTSSNFGKHGLVKNSSSGFGSYTYYDFNGAEQKVPYEWNGSFFVQDSSLEVGDVGIGFSRSNDGPKALGIFYFETVTFEDIPMPTEYIQVRAGGNRVAVTAGDDFYRRIPFLRTGKSTYQRIGVPKGAITVMNFSAMNSHDEYLMDVTYPDLTAAKPAWKVRSERCLFSGNKYYRLTDIERKFFPLANRVNCGISTEFFDERGDLIATEGTETYLLRRQK